MATMNRPCYKAIVEHAVGKPALVFVASRRQTRLTALDLISIAGQDDSVRGGAAALWVSPDVDPGELEALASRCQDSALRDALPFGVGLHHAGLAEADRDVVERLFERGKIRVLVCTATLAWGVNFPARLVVIKGTEYFDAKVRKYVDFPITDVLQMMGRAGRPQYDTTGVAVVLVHAPKKDFYKKFLYEPFPVESQLGDNLHNLINAEICATGSIKDRDDAVAFLKYTYLYRRLVQNPSYYQLADDAPATIDAFLIELVQAVLDDLESAGAVSMSDDDGFKFVPETLGKIASYYYLDYKTTRDCADALDRIEDETLFDAPDARAFADDGPDDDCRVLVETTALELLCAAREFDELPVRHNEDILNEELADDLGLRFFSAYDDPHVKAALLIHARLRGLGHLPVADYVTDTRSVLEQTSRVMAAMIDVAADSGALKTTLALCRLSQAIASGVSASRDELCQIPGVLDKDASGLRASLRLSRAQGLLHALRGKRPRLLNLLSSSSSSSSSSEENKFQAQRRRFLDGLPTSVDLEATVDHPDGCLRADDVYTLRVRLALRGGQASNKSTQKKPHLAGWWLVLALGPELVALKRVTLRGRHVDAALLFAAPEDQGPATLVLHALPDDLRGFDARTEIPISVVSPTAPAAGTGSSGSGGGDHRAPASGAPPSAGESAAAA